MLFFQADSIVIVGVADGSPAVGQVHLTSHTPLGDILKLAPANWLFYFSNQKQHLEAQ